MALPHFFASVLLIQVFLSKSAYIYLYIEREHSQYLLSAKNESRQKWPVCQVNKKEGHTVSIYVCNLLSLAKSKFTNNQTQGHSWPSVYTHQSIN